MAEQTLPSPAVPLIKTDGSGRPDDTWYQRLTLMWKAFNSARSDVDTTTTDLAAAVARIAALEAASVSGALGTYTALSSTTTTLTGISTTAKMVVLNIVGMSWDNTHAVRIRIGPSGGVATSGYLSAQGVIAGGGASTGTNGTAGFDQSGGQGAGAIYHGNLIFTLADASSNTWACSGALGRSDVAQSWTFSGIVPLSGALEQIAITTVAGTASADAGSAAISVYSHA